MCEFWHSLTWVWSKWKWFLSSLKPSDVVAVDQVSKSFISLPSGIMHGRNIRFRLKNFPDMFSLTTHNCSMSNFLNCLSRARCASLQWSWVGMSQPGLDTHCKPEYVWHYTNFTWNGSTFTYVCFQYLVNKCKII